VPQLYKIRNRAFLQELVSYGPGKNTDRVSAMFQAMFYREQFIILYGTAEGAIDDTPDVSDDDFFDIDWKRHLSKLGPDYNSTLNL